MDPCRERMRGRSSKQIVRGADHNVRWDCPGYIKAVARYMSRVDYGVQGVVK